MAREPANRASLYGRLQLKRVSGRLHAIEAILARATPATTATLFLGVGRCLFTAEVLDHAGRLLDHPPAEELDDAMIFQRMLAHGGPVHGLHLKGRRYDIATPDGYVAAWRRFGREKPTWKSH
jgi:UTP-glucose-1-phosphate uridylyltransferase